MEISGFVVRCVIYIWGCAGEYNSGEFKLHSILP
jgi:hypothetical protein